MPSGELEIPLHKVAENTIIAALYAYEGVRQFMDEITETSQEEHGLALAASTIGREVLLPASMGALGFAMTRKVPLAVGIALGTFVGHRAKRLWDSDQKSGFHL